MYYSVGFIIGSKNINIHIYRAYLVILWFANLVIVIHLVP